MKYSPEYCNSINWRNPEPIDHRFKNSMKLCPILFVPSNAVLISCCVALSLFGGWIIIGAITIGIIAMNVTLIVDKIIYPSSSFNHNNSDNPDV